MVKDGIPAKTGIIQKFLTTQSVRRLSTYLERFLINYSGTKSIKKKSLCAEMNNEQGKSPIF